MSSATSPSPVGEAALVASPTPSLPLRRHQGEVVKTGNLRKVKTKKKKFFVLRRESSDSSARLEYYDTEKNFTSHQPPKRSISLKACFNINRCTDSKQKYVIALYTKDDRFLVGFDSEKDRESWLQALCSLQNGDDVTDGETPKPIFEHVWPVEVANKGLGHSRKINGRYHLCLTVSGKTVSLVRILPDSRKDAIEFPLKNIRSCGEAQSFFYMELGRNAVTGTGEIWMQVEDANIAKDMHLHITGAMRNSRDDTGSKQIGRSASVSESSKPISMVSRRQTHTGFGKPDEAGSSVSSQSSVPLVSEVSSVSASNLEPYCEMQKGSAGGITLDTDVSALSRTGSVPYNFLYCQTTQRSHVQQQQLQCRLTTNFLSRPNQRRHSVSAVSVSTPGAAGCWAVGSKGGAQVGAVTTGVAPPLVHHHQRTYSFPLSPLPPSTSVRRGSIGTKAGHRASSTGLSNAHYSSAGRDRSDSLPSTMRVSSEHHTLSHGHHSHHGVRPGHIIACRPHSLYSRCISHSPPVASSPVSPASGACSTDSAGSSLSIDEGDNWGEGNIGEGNIPGISRYSAVHPLTPESPIEEETSCDEYVHWSGPSAPDSGVGEEEKVNNYVPMDRSTTTLSLPIQQHSGTIPVRKYSPGRTGPVSTNATGQKSGSPSHFPYMEMCGSFQTSPHDNSGNYLTMSPGAFPDSARNTTVYNRGGIQTSTAPSSANHSRASSLAEETPDGYTPMMPALTDDGYVDMDPAPLDDFHHGEMSPSSSCSITSGTPSTDLRFSEYPLEKVNSYFTPSEEEETGMGERPTRCYSVGSKPDSLKKKNRLEIINQTDCSRVRAFSVGSRNAPGSKLASRPLAHDLHATRHTLQAGGHFTPPSHHRLQQQQPGANSKSLSAPILSNSLSGSPMNRQLLGGSHSSVEPMDDLMEMDFSPSVSTSSKSGRNKSGIAKSSSRNKSASTNDYLGMSSTREGDGEKVLKLHCGPSLHSSQSSVASSYSTAEGLDVSAHIGSPRTHDSLGPGSPPKTSTSRNNLSNSYGRSPPDTTARSPPSRIAGSPRSAVTRMSCISELKPQNFPSTTPSPPIKQSLLATNNSTMAAKMAKLAISGPYVEMNPSAPASKPVIVTSASSKTTESGPYVEMKGRPLSGPVTAPSSAASVPRHGASPAPNEDYMDMSFKPSRKTSVPEGKELQNTVMRTAPLDTPNANKKPPDGYVDMSWHGNKPGCQSSFDGYRLSARGGSSGGTDDYMNMSGGSSNNSRNRKERRGSRKERNQFRSQPINIQQTGQQGRKAPADTPPKVPPSHLPLGTSVDSPSPSSSPFSSLGRNRSRKSSKDSCGSTASGLTTPTGSNSTIFPMSINSPGSPLKPFPAVTTASSVPKLAAAPGSSFDNLEKVPVDMSSGTLRLSYPQAEISPAATLANLDETPTDPKVEHDYVNFNPGPVASSSDKQSKEKSAEDFGDYAVMCPSHPTSPMPNKEYMRKPSTPVSSASSKSVSQLSNDDGMNVAMVLSPAVDISRSSKPLTVSSLLGMNNLSPVTTASQLNNLNSSLSSATPETAHPNVFSSKLTSNVVSNERKLQNCESTSAVCTTAATTTTTLVTSLPLASLTSVGSGVTENSAVNGEMTESSVGTSTLTPASTPSIFPSPNLSPCPSPNPSPSPNSESSHSQTSPASQSSAREKKMSSGSDSSTASRDSQLLARKYSAGSVSPSRASAKNKSTSTCSTPANRRLSCPTKSSVSRQASLSSEASEVEVEDAKLSATSTSLSRQTSSSSVSGEVAAANLSSTEKRSLSCSPVPASVSPVARSVVDHQINYASLDLRQGSELEDANSKSHRSLKTQGSLNETASSTSSPSPNPAGGTFTYAQIDFEKSEELRKANAAKNSKQ